MCSTPRVVSKSTNNSVLPVLRTPNVTCASTSPFLSSLSCSVLCVQKCDAIRNAGQEWERGQFTLRLDGPGLELLRKDFGRSAQPMFVRHLCRNVRGLIHLQLDGVCLRGRAQESTGDVVRTIVGKINKVVRINQAVVVGANLS